MILATGGFSANVEMREKYNTHWATLDESIPTSNGPQATGDGIIMAEAIGANLVGMEWIQMLPTTMKSFTPAIDSTILVNKEGKRFVKEDGRRDEMCIRDSLHFNSSSSGHSFLLHISQETERGHDNGSSDRQPDFF